MRIQTSDVKSKAGISAGNAIGLFTAPGLFEDMLAETKAAASYQSMNERHRQIILQGQDILQRIDIRKIQEYKKKITDFIEELSGQTYLLSEEEYTDSHGRSKYLSTIENIHKEFEEIFELTRESEKNALAILSKIEGINGLVIDLLI